VGVKVQWWGPVGSAKWAKTVQGCMDISLQGGGAQLLLTMQAPGWGVLSGVEVMSARCSGVWA
jgi:hypothetical protein